MFVSITTLIFGLTGFFDESRISASEYPCVSMSVLSDSKAVYVAAQIMLVIKYLYQLRTTSLVVFPRFESLSRFSAYGIDTITSE